MATSSHNVTGYAPATSRSNGLAIAGLVCGIVGLFIANFILGPLAIIFGGVGLSKASHGGAHRTMAVWSIALGVLDIVVFAVLIAVASHHGGSIYFRG